MSEGCFVHRADLFELTIFSAPEEEPAADPDAWLESREHELRERFEPQLAGVEAAVAAMKDAGLIPLVAYDPSSPWKASAVVSDPARAARGAPFPAPVLLQVDSDLRSDGSRFELVVSVDRQVARRALDELGTCVAEALWGASHAPAGDEETTPPA